MSMFGFGEAVQWAAYTGTPDVVDELGDQVDTWAEPVTIDDCGFDPGKSTEPRDGSAQRVITSPVLYAPAVQTIGPRDKITARGRTYEVEGEPADWSDPLVGTDPGMLVVALKQVEG